MWRSLFIIVFLVLLSCLKLPAQEGIHNYGNLQLHKNGSLGFHGDFSNNGGFDNNLGLIGFYHPSEPLQIRGAFSPTFHEMELGVENGLDLYVSININHHLNFIYGNIHTDMDREINSVNFQGKAAYFGVSDLSKVSGRVSVKDQNSFKFPVGIDDLFRPIRIDFVGDVFRAKCAYFLENPGFPQSFGTPFDTGRKVGGLNLVSPQEFWNLDTSGRIQVTLFWDSSSNLSYYTQNVEEISVAGWNRNKKMWENLGNGQLSGDLNQGSVQSNIFNANDYEIFTYGFLAGNKLDEPGNYAITPNGDGINDYFTLKILEKSPNNEFRVFDRAGLLVFEQSNYKDEFSGKGNKNIFMKGEYLPEGVYFYLLELKDLNLKYQGYFYLQTK